MSSHRANFHTYYATHSPITDPRDSREMLQELPEDVPALCRVIRNVCMHNWEAQRDGLQLSETQRQDIEIRSVSQLLERIRELDSQPLTRARSKNHLLVVDCRHFATLLCAMLREQGVPARIRSGFASYLEDGRFQQHVVCEYWEMSEQRWVLADADTGMPDVSAATFLVAGHAWEQSRMGVINPEQFGYGANWSGLWAIAAETVRDLAALNKFEFLTFDAWGLVAEIFDDQRSERFTEEELALLDTIAHLHAADVEAFDCLRTLYVTDKRLQVPRWVEVRPYTGRPNYVVDLAEQHLLLDTE